MNVSYFICTREDLCVSSVTIHGKRENRTLTSRVPVSDKEKTNRNVVCYLCSLCNMLPVISKVWARDRCMSPVPGGVSTKQILYISKPVLWCLFSNNNRLRVPTSYTTDRGEEMEDSTALFLWDPLLADTDFLFCHSGSKHMAPSTNEWASIKLW